MSLSYANDSIFQTERVWSATCDSTIAASLAPPRPGFHQSAMFEKKSRGFAGKYTVRSVYE